MDELQVINRKSISQRCVSRFPFFVNNVGMSKLIIKNKLKGGFSMVYEIPETERFVNFAEFNAFEDLGFDPRKLRIEMCTNIVFLTQALKDDTLIVNIFLIDPYYEVC